ncbi:TPR-like protein, partial [Imleria badia]
MGSFHPLQDVSDLRLRAVTVSCPTNIWFLLHPVQKNDELSRTNSAFDAFKSQHTTLQRDSSNLQSALDAEKGTAVRANQRISTLQSDFQTAQCSNSNLQSALDAQKGAVIKANQTISNLQSDLATTQSALDALKREAAEDRLKLSLGIGDFKQWMRQNSVNADSLISDPDPLTSSSDIHHVFAHNALVNVRSKDRSLAYANARKSIDARPSTMGYIAKALAQIGMGEPEKAVQVFDLAFANCNPDESNLLLLIKTILLFMARKCDTAISRVHDLIAISRDDETTYCCIQVLGKMYLMQGDYVRAVQSLERGQGLASSCTGSDLETISLIFGWTFDGLRITVQRYLCEDLYTSGRAVDAAEALLNITDTFGEEIRTNKVTAEWVMDLKRKCIDTLESLGDTSLSSGEHDNAIARYTSALSLDPSNPVDILMKRSKARASKGLWQDSLADANEVIKQDPSSHFGYERKYVALHGAQDYGEANNALLHMLSVIENSPDEEIRRLRANYTAPRET